MAVIALDLGGTKLAGAVFDSSGKSLVRSLAALEGRSGKAVGALICDQIQSLLEASRAKRSRIRAIGVSVPGISHPNGRVWAPNIPSWENYPLASEIQSICHSRGLRKTPVVIDNDRACYIMGEAWRGQARGCENAVFLAVGTGIGAGILANGRILNGHCGTAGSIGWMALDRPFRREYIREGCFEHHASGRGLDRAASRALGNAKTAADVFAACRRGERIGKTLLANAIECWGMAVANVVSLFNPEIIILGGGVFGPAAEFLPRIRAEAEKWAQPVAMKRTRVRVSKLGPDAGLLGAGYFAVKATHGKTK